MWQKGGAGLLISILISTLIIGLASFYMLNGGFTSKPGQPSYQSDIDQAKEAQIQANFHGIQTALESYKLKQGHYPTSLDDLVQSSMITGGLKNPYNNLQYEYESDGSSYTLSTKLGDGSNYQITN